MKVKILVLMLTVWPVLAPAQREPVVPLWTEEEKRTVEEQSQEFNVAILPSLMEAARSTVRVWGIVGGRRGGSGDPFGGAFRGEPAGGNEGAGRDRRLAYGTVIGDGRTILTKWSEVAKVTGDFRVEAHDREVRAVRVVGVYEEEDIAVLEVEGEPLAPVDWSFEPLELGRFLVAAQPDGVMAGYGVVSVLERNLKDSDQAYLGVQGVVGYEGEGVQVQEVMEGTAAEAAGLKKGDVILRVGEKVLSGMQELVEALAGYAPGSEVELLVKREDKELAVDVILGSRPDSSQFSGLRLLQMKRMGGALSRVRAGFTKVVETDMHVEPDQVGGPVAGLDGRVVGITLAREGRTNTYLMTAARVSELLSGEAMDPAAALAKLEEKEQAMAAATRARPRIVPRPRPGDDDALEKMQRNLTDMRRLMDRVRRELGALGEE